MKTHRCENCGAPATVSSNDSWWTCAYCGSTTDGVRVKKTPPTQSSYSKFTDPPEPVWEELSDFFAKKTAAFKQSFKASTKVKLQRKFSCDYSTIRAPVDAHISGDYNKIYNGHNLHVSGDFNVLVDCVDVYITGDFNKYKNCKEVIIEGDFNAEI